MIELRVTEDHIAKGSRKYYTYDPIALAARQELGAISASFGWGYWSIRTDAKTLSGDIVNSVEVTSWIRNWDRGLSVAPITVRLATSKEAPNRAEPTRRPAKIRSYYDQPDRKSDYLRTDSPVPPVQG